MPAQVSHSALEGGIAAAASPRPELAAAYVFGSAATGTSTPLSDVDVALLFRDPALDPLSRRTVVSTVAGELARTFEGLPFDVRDLEDLPLALQGRVLTQGRLVLDADPSRRVVFEVRTRMLYFDFLPFQSADTREGLRGLRRRFRSG